MTDLQQEILQAVPLLSEKAQQEVLSLIKLWLEYEQTKPAHDAPPTTPLVDVWAIPLSPEQTEMEKKVAYVRTHPQKGKSLNDWLEKAAPISDEDAAIMLQATDGRCA